MTSADLHPLIICDDSETTDSIMNSFSLNFIPFGQDNPLIKNKYR